MRKLGEALEKGLVDLDVIPLLDEINEIEGAVTTSSCSGRIQLIQMSRPGDKLGSRILGKWHRKVDREEVVRAAEEWNGDGQLHLLVQPLLVHIRCRDILTASRLRNLAHGNGLKFSTIRSVKNDVSGSIPDWGFVVEFLGTERMEVPLHVFEKEMFTEIIPPLTEHGNSLMESIKKRIPEMSLAIREMKDDGNTP